MMWLLNLPTRDSLCMRRKILIVEKIDTDGLSEKQTQLKKHFSHLLFPSTIKPSSGSEHFLLQIRIGLLFMV